MNRLLRVLIVEDSEDDALLVVHQLKQAEYEISFERVETEAAMEAALSKEKWDVIISDYVLPHFSGFAALKLLQRKGIDLPFIIVSGKIGEDVAVEAIKTGAHDYLMKNNLKRLVVTVEQGMREAENRQELKKTEEELRENEERLRDITFSMADWVWEVDEKGAYTYSSHMGSKLLGQSSEDIIGKTPFDFMPPDEAKRVAVIFSEIMANKAPIKDLENWNISKNGERVCFLTNGVPMLDEKGNLKGYRGVDKDITKRKQQEEQIRHAAEEWRTTFDSITDLVAVIDREFRLVRVNKAFADAFGMHPKEVVGKTCYELVHGTREPWFSCPYKKTIETKQPNTTEFFEPHLKIDLEVSTSPIFDDQGEVVASAHITKDISQRKAIEKSRRLSQLGKLVADMAHEVNNPLMIISGSAQLCLMEVAKEEEMKNNLRIIFEESQRAKNIIQRLLKFSRPSKGETKEADINKSIEAVVGIVEHQFKLDNIEIKRDYYENLPPITIDEQQMQEVFMNLMNNAKDAMPDGGTITITTALEGDFLRMDFKDTGSGMSEEVKKKILEPFFTTKEKGTGLGLSVCYGIIKAHNGELRFESELNKGTTVSILLPLGGRA